MGLKDSLVNLMGDFVQMNKNPEFRSKTELSTIPGTSSTPQNRGGRRHSLNITVGTAGPPPPDMIHGRRNRTRSECPVPDLAKLETMSAKIRNDDQENTPTNQHLAPRRHSAPIGLTGSQRIKLERIFSHIEETDEEEDYESEEEKFAQSVSKIQISEDKEVTKIQDASNGAVCVTNGVAQKC